MAAAAVPAALQRRPGSSRLGGTGWFDLALQALALVLVFEGLLPLCNPAAWRRAMQRVMQLSDGQLRFFGLLCVGAGVLLLALLRP